MSRRAWLIACLIACAAPLSAHEARPAYLEVKETAPGRYDLLWRTPVLSGMRLPIVLQVPSTAKNLKEPTVQQLTDSLLERRSIDAGARGLAGQRIEFPGLQATITDVLVRVELLDGRKWTTIVHPSQPWIEIAAPQGRLAVLGSYVVHGIRHIAFGADHLLFVLGPAPDREGPLDAREDDHRVHGRAPITLAIATFGWAEAPVLPLNAAIALSIFFLGPEIVRSWRGETSFTIEHPWVVAFVFGLIHGFGFASRADFRRSAPCRPPARASRVQRRRRDRAGRIRAARPAPRALVPRARDPLAALGRGAARLRGRHARRVLDDSTNGHPVRMDA